jgi:hypothetical protein
MDSRRRVAHREPSVSATILRAAATTRVASVAPFEFRSALRGHPCV